MYLILSKDINNLANRINNTIEDINPTVKVRVIKITPSYEITKLIVLSDIYNYTKVPLDQSFKNFIKGFELIYNPTLYKEQLIDPDLSVLESSAEDLIRKLSLLFSTPKTIIALILGILGISETYLFYKYYKAEGTKTWEKVVIILIVLASIIFGFNLFRKKIANAKDRKSIEQSAIKTGLISTSSDNLIVENYSFLRLLESEENKNIVRKIVSTLFESPEKARLYTIQLVKQVVPNNSETYNNYLNLLKH
jgi:hypothetical protein